jgi:hypothetical protein
MEAQIRSAFLFLTDGRLLVRRDDGSILDADAFERDFAADMLAGSGVFSALRGRELLPPAEN